VTVKELREARAELAELEPKATNGYFKAHMPPSVPDGEIVAAWINSHTTLSLEEWIAQKAAELGITEEPI
jgi:hypothetical protein